ncbi:hypothetical protein RIF29_21659 [Crotalaria pallida]|uniref:RRM domain-containing protein n=1 Tax=Crotalaria pallida TaxID=3830 RepID=A0AAN9F7R8_CROPI
MVMCYYVSTVVALDLSSAVRRNHLQKLKHLIEYAMRSRSASPRRRRYADRNRQRYGFAGEKRQDNERRLDNKRSYVNERRLMSREDKFYHKEEGWTLVRRDQKRPRNWKLNIRPSFGNKNGPVMQQRRKSFSLFVDNIHPSLTKHDLWKIFQEFGEVVHLYISLKRRENKNQLFGFVRYGTKEDASEAIRRTKGLMVKGEKLFVKWASQENKGDDERIEDPGRQPNMQRSGGDASQEQLRVVQANTIPENIAWLQRRLIMETKRPSNIEEILLKLVNLWPTICMVRDIGAFKFIVTFRSYDDRQEAFERKQQALTMDFIKRVIKWTPEVVYERRKVWLKVYGIPPHGWNKENFVRIIDRIGAIVDMDPNTEDGISMESAKICVTTELMPFIEDHLFISLNNQRFEIFVKETEGEKIFPWRMEK